jgi:uncharacterized membrane protein
MVDRRDYKGVRLHLGCREIKILKKSGVTFYKLGWSISEGSKYFIGVINIIYWIFTIEVLLLTLFFY